MNFKLFAMTLILLSSTLSGCLEDEVLESLEQECVTLPAGHEDDGKLRILTYDVLALTDSMIDGFETSTGIEVEFIKETDSGGILDQMMLTKGAQQADLMIGLDNSYLQTAVDNCLHVKHYSHKTRNIKTSLPPQWNLIRANLQYHLMKGQFV